MGDPRKKRKQYAKPRKAFQKERILKEKDARTTYGLKNTKEYLRAESIIRRKRTNAKKLLALPLEQRLKREKELLDGLKRIGILSGQPTLGDVLTLTPEALLERRLQTVVLRKGLATTVKQSRQFIVHGHIAVGGDKVDRPGYLVTLDDDAKITYHKKEMILEQKKTAVAAKEVKSAEMRKNFEEAKPTDAIDSGDATGTDAE